MEKKTGLITAWILACAMILSLAGCGTSNQTTNGSDTSSSDAKQTEASAVTSLEKVDMAAWNYDADNDFYWKTGITYCESPADSSYETMGFYYDYIDALNANGTWVSYDSASNTATITSVADAIHAPTAMNQQKFKIMRSGNKVTAKAGMGFYTKIDLGIVKYNFEIGAGKENFSWT